MNNTITVDKDRFDFLLYAYFGESDNPYPMSLPAKR